MDNSSLKPVSKPGIARSLLSRVSSKANVNRDDESPTKAEPSSPLAATPTTMPPIQRQSTQAPLSVQPASIEQSVRMFRLYEALRHGDTAAISKAIKETSGSREDIRTSTSSTANPAALLDGTSILHLAIQCADIPVVEFVLSNLPPATDVNVRDKDGNTPLHVATLLSRAPVVRILLAQESINDSLQNYSGKTALDLAKNPEVFQQLQLARSLYIDNSVKHVQALLTRDDYDSLEKILVDPHFQSAVDVNGGELATDPQTIDSGGTLLHEAARKKNAKLIQILLLNGADPFRRDRRGKLPQDVTKDDRTRNLLRKSPAAAAAQRGVQEKTILGSGGPQAIIGTATGENALGGKDGREMKGFLKKWVNYTTGYKLRWFVLEDGVLSYYKHQDDAGSACRGAINMKIARLHMDAQDKQRFEIAGKSSVKYHLKANHQIEAKRWFWALNNAIQHAKDEAKEAERAQNRNTEMLKQAKLAQAERFQSRDPEAASFVSAQTPVKALSSSAAASPIMLKSSGRSMTDDEDGGASAYEPSLSVADEFGRGGHSFGTTAVDADAENEDDYGDDASSIEEKPVNRDAFMIAAQSAKLQLDLLSQITGALQAEKSRNPETAISEPTIVQAMTSCESAIANLTGLVGDLGRIARDREAYWHYRLDQEINVRRMWEDNMAKIAKEQEELEAKIGESEEKRKRTKRALKDALDGQLVSHSEAVTPLDERDAALSPEPVQRKASQGRRKSNIADLANISDSDSDGDEEFFDAVDAGKVEVVDDLPMSARSIKSPPLSPQQTNVSTTMLQAKKQSAIETSFVGYENPVRTRLKLDADNRPKISLWGILKSMIGKDMTKMTLPVSFNEPTSLLQRVAEDMEYTDLLDDAADRADSTERLVYVATFAASEYASTIGRVAKPFNPLLAETYEYVRPDKGYRFFIEQVSHHPPVGAAWAESSKWDYYGESAVKSKFYGRSFDINPLGTWFLRLRPSSDPDVIEELYTWKKVTSSVVGIITGNPTVDNYGAMEVKNHTTGEVCILDFKQRGWKASSAFQVSGKVLDRDGNTRWSIGGRWNDKIYARLTPGYEGSVTPPTGGKKGGGNRENQAFLVWEAHARPTGIPFNLTPFVVTLNALTPALQARLPPTDTRLRPDQRAMEDGEYDLAATEKNRVEEKQRAKRREREQEGEEFTPRWFRKAIDKTTGEEYWVAKGSPEDKEDGGGGASAGKGVEYWSNRASQDWTGVEDIF